MTGRELERRRWREVKEEQLGSIDLALEAAENLADELRRCRGKMRRTKAGEVSCAFSDAVDRYCDTDLLDALWSVTRRLRAGRETEAVRS